jgi:hypothetical protein
MHRICFLCRQYGFRECPAPFATAFFYVLVLSVVAMTVAAISGVIE